VAQQYGGTAVHEWSHSAGSSSVGDAWSQYRTKAQHPSRSRSHLADLVIDFVCLVVASLALDPIDRSVLFEQYDFKLWSQHDRLLVFCVSVLPALLGMAAVYVAFKAIHAIRSMI